MADSTVNYTNISNIKDHWKNVVAPNYFDLSNTNNYNISTFGYINEILGNTSEDSFNAIATARREFYPTTAQFQTSLYTMAALQGIDIPVTTPAVCNCALILEQRIIVENSTFNDGIYECVLDSTMKIFAGEIPFMIDYPIKILSKKNTITGEWSHTIHYDITSNNSLNTTPSDRYISNKIITADGVKYLILYLSIVRQLEMEEITKIILKDSVLDTITVDVDFTGDLANFEVFYRENSNSSELQLQKVLKNGNPPTIPYVFYEMLTNNRIRLTFTYNDIFVPGYNSEVICRIYTSLGADGNFNSYDDDLVASIDSERYPYNSNFTILGRINGSSYGGADRPLFDDFKSQVVKAYSTNNTITTASDLRIYYDDIADDVNNVNILFKKKRDDALIRLFGAYIVVKDGNNDVMPANTLTIESVKSDFVPDMSTLINRYTIPAGTVFEYKDSDSFVTIPSKNPDGSLLSIIDVTNDISNTDVGIEGKHYFTNPFMMTVSINPNIVGYYMNSVTETMGIEYTYVNDQSTNQFIGGTLSIYRDSICGSNYYRFRIKLSAASQIDKEYVLQENDITLPENQIIAKYSGRIIKEEFYMETPTSDGYIRYTIQYDTDIEAEKIAYIQGSNTVSPTNLPTTGYKLLYNVGDYFVAGNVLATKRVTDLGKIMICGDLNGVFYHNKLYTIFSIQDYDSSLDAYVMECYLATTDEIDFDERLVLSGGIFDDTGDGNRSVSIDLADLFIELNVLFVNPEFNIEHKYSLFTGLSKYTLTNTYVSREDAKFNLIYPMRFARSTVTFAPIDVGDLTNEDFKVIISESPVLGAFWAVEQVNYDYFVVKYTLINDQLNDAFYQLENNFSIDSKFYNTYGKSRYYTIGNATDGMVPLDNVKCKFKFGLNLVTISSTEEFYTMFRAYIKDYIESSDRVTIDGQDLYVMNLISALKENFSEIAYLEYYGMNSYDNTAQKIIGPDLNIYRGDFIPEFLNMNSIYDENGNVYPDIEIIAIK